MGDSNTQKMLRVLLSPAAELEACMMAVLTQRSIDTAVGAQLTVLGKIVGRDSRDPDDEIERRLVRAQISVNKSDGLVTDKITIARLVIGDPAAHIVINNLGNGATILRVENVALTTEVAAVLIRLLLRAVSDGVRQLVGFTTVDPTTVLRWSTQGVWGTAVWGAIREREI